jgi:hypothetical protein
VSPVYYGYLCPNCGEIDSQVAVDSFVHLECGVRAKRIYRVAINKSSLKHGGRWDPVVGRYVANQGEFESLLHAAADRESAELGMDVKLVEIDARDIEGINELRSMTPEQRDADLEGTRKAQFDRSRK